MKMIVDITEAEITTAVREFIERRYSMDVSSMKTADLVIEVKSAQNYKSEWEMARFRGRFTVI